MIFEGASKVKNIIQSSSLARVRVREFFISKSRAFLGVIPVDVCIGFWGDLSNVPGGKHYCIITCMKGRRSYTH